MNRKDIASALEEIGLLLELQDENPFKIKAYQQAARTVLRLDGDLREIVASGELARVKGIGPALREKISEMVATGRSTYLEQLRGTFPEGLLELLTIPGLGPRKINALHTQLHITNLGELEYACLENRLVGLKGFGSKTQAHILKGIEERKKYRGFFLWAEAEGPIRELIEGLSACPALYKIEAAGDFRRLNEVVNRADIVAVCHDEERVIEHLGKLNLVSSFENLGRGELSIKLDSGLEARLHLAPEATWPVALLHLTGNDDHIASLRKRAEAAGMRLEPEGLYDRSGRSVRADSEDEIYRRLGLDYIPPEMREGRGEIEAAAAGALPDLVKPADIKGVFHVHSHFSDGGLSIAELVGECRALGYEYLGLSDHSRTAFYAGGLSIEDLDRQFAQVEDIRQANPSFGLFWGIESDILPDGSLDYPDEILARFDFIIASVHSVFNLSREDMTRRLIRAARNPYTTILGHATGRLLLAREPYPVDLDAVLEAAAETGTIIEINANPHRLDLDWRECSKAVSLGCKIIINPDAHSAQGLGDVRYGVQIARKGWLTRADVLNCLDRAELTAFLSGLKAGKHAQPGGD